MNRPLAIAILLVAALLESGGDAVMRTGLNSPALGPKILRFALAALLLTAYGLTVNAPRWDFGRLLGIYVVFFFVLAQLISWLFFHTPPSRTVLAGGLLIVAGGVVISLGAY